MKYFIFPILVGISLAASRAVVHNPAIIKSDGQYYLFGSHLAVAKSDDLIKWTQISNTDYEDPITNPIYGNLRETLKNHLNGQVMMMEILQEEDMLYGPLILFIIQIIFGVMEVKGLICSIMLLHQLGVVHVLDS